MKSLSVVLVFTISLACARATPGFINTNFLECQKIYPSVKSNPADQSTWYYLIRGEVYQLSREEKCMLHCLLQDKDYFDDNGYLRRGSAYVKHLIEAYPTMAKYSDVLMAQIFQTARTARSIDDKCERAFVTHHQIILTVFTLRMARSIEDVTHIKDKTINTVESEQNVDHQETSKQLDQYFEFFDALIKDDATWETMEGDTSTRLFCKLKKSMDTLQPNAATLFHRSSSIQC